MNKTQVILAVIGAGEGALPIVKKAKEMNVQTLAFGYIDSLAREFTDVFVFTSARTSVKLLYRFVANSRRSSAI